MNKYEVAWMMGSIGYLLGIGTVYFIERYLG